jgi:xanthine dehydrogenase molybdenum-binding subunit
MEAYKYIGKAIPKLDAPEKLTGRATYLHDLVLPGMLHGRILRSEYPHARVLNVDVSRARSLAGVKAVITYQDTPKLKFGFAKDKLPLKGDKVRSLSDELAAVAAIDEDCAAEAVNLIKVDYQPLPAVFDTEQALAPAAPQIHEPAPGNLITFLPYKFEYGDIQQAAGQADCIVTDTFILPYVTHCCLGTLSCMASFDSRGRLTIYSNTQAPFLYQRELAAALAMDPGDIRVIQPCIGGAFGRGLDIYPFEPICALLAAKSGRPVKIVLERKEDFVASPTRQPCRIELKSGANKDGSLLFREAEAVLDCGAYLSWGAVTPWMMMATSTTLYNHRATRFSSKLVYTNNPTTGAMRGFGNLQITFAIESQMDGLASELGLDPLEIRLKNANKPGQVSPQGFKITSCGLAETIQRAARALDWKERKGKARGRGLACMFHVGGGGRVYRSDGCGAIVKLDDFGHVVLITGATEIGQGSDSALAAIVAEELGIPLERVSVVNSDTDVKPWDVGVHASRTTFVAGNAARLAAAKAKEQIKEEAARLLEARADDLEIKDGRVFVAGSPDKGLEYEKVIRGRHFRGQGQIVTAEAFYDPPTEMLDKDYKGNISAAYSFGTQAAEVEVDEETGKVRIIKMVAAYDVGQVVNLAGAEGSVHGGIHMGLGYALSEELVVREGKILNPTLADYRLFTGQDMPPVEVIFIEGNDPAGPFGAKGLGEAGAIPVAPAIANAIFAATGVRLKQLPITPERLAAAIKGG